MSVVILKWNPRVSSWSNYDHVKRIIKNNKNSDSKMNWSVWEYDKVKKGDKCFLLKVGYGANGIVDAGVILSKPYKSDDWSNENRNNIYYADFESKLILNYDTVPILTSEELSKNIPDFDWTKGHSGAVLSENQAEKFLELWNNYLETNRKVLIERIESNRIDAVFWNEKDFYLAKKELENSLANEYSVDGKISYCSVRFDSGERTFFYIDKTGKLKEGNYVKVPFGQRNSLKIGIIDSVKSYTKAKVPYPLSRTKCILEKIENPSDELVESLRKPKGEEVYKWKKFIAQLSDLEDENIYLNFEINNKKFEITVAKYSSKIFVSIKGYKKPDAEIYPTVEEFLDAKLFNKFKLKDIWKDLIYVYF